MAEAYCSIPIKPVQWPGIVVQLNDTNFAMDMVSSLRELSSSGTFTKLADTGTDIAWAIGIGTISNWVNNHVFFRILLEYRTHYNTF